MVAQTLLDDHVQEKNVLIAAKSVIAWTKKNRETLEEQSLLPPKEDHVWLIVATKRIPKSHKLKPIKIPVVHPIIDPRETSICLFTKDPQREYKDLLAEQKINFISRVVGVTKLKGKHKPFEARRQLLNDHGIFLADQRVVPLLGNLLGKMYFDAKKQPVPVDLTAKDLKKELARAVSSTYMHQNAGTCVSIKIASISHTPEEIVANLTSALPAIVKHIEGGWENVLSLSIKTGRSTSLPVWSCELDERFTVPSLDAARRDALEAKGKEKTKENAKEKKETGSETSKANGRKRKADELDGVATAGAPQKAAKKMKDAQEVENDENEFGGFGSEEDHDKDVTDAKPKDELAGKASKIDKKKSPAKSKSSPSAPISVQAAASKTGKKTQKGVEDDLEPLTLVSSSGSKAKPAKTLAKHIDVKAPRKEVTRMSAPSSITKSDGKLDKTNKKGVSVQQLQKKLKPAGKQGTATTTKKQVLGKKRVEG